MFLMEEGVGVGGIISRFFQAVKSIGRHHTLRYYIHIDVINRGEQT